MHLINPILILHIAPLFRTKTSLHIKTLYKHVFRILKEYKRLNSNYRCWFETFCSIPSVSVKSEMALIQSNEYELRSMGYHQILSSFSDSLMMNYLHVTFDYKLKPFGQCIYFFKQKLKELVHFIIIILVLFMYQTTIKFYYMINFTVVKSYCH